MTQAIDKNGLAREFATWRAHYSATGQEREFFDRIAAYLSASPQPQAHEAEPSPEPYIWVIEHPDRGPDWHSPGEQGFTEFLDEPKPGAFALYRHPQAEPSPAAQPVAFRWRMSADDHWSAPHSIEHLPSLLPDDGRIIEYLGPLASPPRTEEGGSRDQGLEEAARICDARAAYFQGTKGHHDREEHG